MLPPASLPWVSCAPGASTLQGALTLQGRTKAFASPIQRFSFIHDSYEKSMVFSSQPSPPPTITVVHQEYREQISLRQLTRDLKVSRANVRRAKNWLIENRHPSFADYVPDSLLSPAQAEAIVTYRSYTTAGIKGDALTEKMFPDVTTAHAKKDALRDLFEQHQLPPEQAAQLTHSILEIFNR